MSNLGPYPRRMWVNQPSKDQPLHKRHGENVLAIPDFGGGAHRAYTLNPDDATSFYAPEGTLSDGWQTPKPESAEAVGEVLRSEDGVARVAMFDDSLQVGTKVYTAPPRPEESESVGVGYAKRLATALWRQHYREDAPQWEPCDDIMSLLSQIDNMVSGLIRSPQMTLGVGDGRGNLFVHGDGDSIRAAQRHVLRSEQLGQARDLLEKVKLYMQRRWYDLEGQNLVTDIGNFLRRVDCE